MLGTLITLGLGSYLLGSAIVGSAKQDENKRNANANNEPYYYDRNHRMRSTSTNEIVTVTLSDPSNNGHCVCTGYDSKRIYHDYTLEKVNKENEKVKAEGKKYYWKEYPTVKEHGFKNACGYKSTFWAYDPEKRSAYKMKMLTYDQKRILYPGKAYVKEYLIPDGPLKNQNMRTNPAYKEEYLTYEEAEPWNYGIMLRF